MMVEYYNLDASLEGTLDWLEGARFLLDISGTVTKQAISPRFLSLFPEDCVGLHISQIFSDKQYGIDEKTLFNAARVGTVVSNCWLSRGENYRPVRVIIETVKDSRGRFTGFKVIVLIRLESSEIPLEKLNRLVHLEPPILSWLMKHSLEFIHSIPEGVVVIDKQSRLRFVNASFCSIVNSDASELIGKRVSRFAGVALRRKAYSKLRSHMHFFLDEALIRCLNGEQKQVRVDVNRSADHNLLIVAIEDLTESLKVKKEIKRVKDEWRLTVDAIRDLIILEGADGTVLRCNRACAEFFSKNYSDIINRPLFGLFFPNQHKPNSAVFRSSSIETFFPGKRGYYEVNSYKVHEQSEASWVHIIKDITSKRDTESFNKLLITAIEQAAEIFVILNRKGIIKYVNPGFERTTGYTSSEVVGKHFSAYPIVSADKQAVRRILRNVLKEGIYAQSHQVRRKDGSTYLAESTLSPIKDSRKRISSFVVVARDVTEKQRLESLAEALDMMKNVGYIFSGIRHELGNPINSIKTALSVLKKNYDSLSDEKVLTYIDRSLAEVSRVEYLLKALKNFSMHENLQLERTDLAAFLHTFLKLVEEDFRNREINLQLKIESEPIFANVDSRALHQVLLNILSNSADALEGQPDPCIFIRLKRKNGKVILTVDDNGIGMSEDQQANLFKPFHTSKTHGTGLGLIITKKLVLKMNGNIDISSRKGLGTTVTIDLEEA